MVEAQNLLGGDRKVVECDAYKIEEEPSAPFPHETHPIVFGLSNTVPWFFSGCYLLLQASFIWSLDTTSSTVKRCFWVGWVVECCLCFVEFNWALDAILPMLVPRQNERRPHYRLLGDFTPHVDVFVTCCGEPLKILMNTIRAAATLDYPPDRFNVVVLDDGHDDDLRAAVDSLNSSGDTVTHVYYRSRKVAPNTRSFFKSGNLNFGIQETKHLSNGEFLASLDADLIVSKNWLRNMVPHLLLDSELGMATSPQNYYNVVSGDALAEQTEFTIWNTIYEPIHDHVGEAMCMGTGFVVRRAALESIGGWPLTDTGEDFMCSTKLVEKGWKIGFVRENFQHGIVPDSFQCRVKQRLRWIDAAFEVHKNNNWYLTNNLGDGVTLMNKISSLTLAARDLVSVSTMFCLMALPIILMVGISNNSNPIPASTQYRLLNILLVTVWTSGKISDWIIYHHIGLAHLSNQQSMDLWVAPYSATRCITHLIGSITGATLTFFVTGAFVCPINERNPSLRAPLLKRLTSYGIPIHILFTTFAIFTITFSIRTLSVSTAIPPILPGHILLLTRCAWKMSVPALYMAFPPSAREWYTYLVPDERGVMRPRKPFPPRIEPDQKGVLEMGWGPRVWRDAAELLVLACVVRGGF